MPRPPRSVHVGLPACALIVTLILSSCSDDGGSADTASDSAADSAATTDTTAGPSTSAPSATATASVLCERAEPVDPSPLVESPDLIEISGLAASRANDGILWAHNDSGGEPEAVAITDEGKGGRPYRLQGVEASDWEDMTLGPGPEEGVDYLFMGDIGDNFSERDEIVIHRTPEPTVDLATTDPVELDDVDSFPVSYADGPRDAEALLSDPITGDLFIVSKEWAGDPVGVYRVPGNVGSGQRVVAMRAAEAPVPAGELVTGGDISADGTIIAIRTYDHVLLWDRRPDQTVDDAMAGQPCQAPVVGEDQGEAIAFATDGRGYVTISEGTNPPVHWFRLPG